VVTTTEFQKNKMTNAVAPRTSFCLLCIHDACGADGTQHTST